MLRAQEFKDIVVVRCGSSRSRRGWDPGIGCTAYGCGGAYGPALRALQLNNVETESTALPVNFSSSNLHVSPPEFP